MSEVNRAHDTSWVELHMKGLKVVVRGDQVPREGGLAAELSTPTDLRLSSPFASPEKLSPALLARVRCEFLEMPGLRLTVARAARLWNVDSQTACVMLQALAAIRFLLQCHDGSYVGWSG